MKSMLKKRLMVGILSLVILFCQMSYPVMASTKEDNMKLHVWVVDENGKSLSGGIIQGSKAGYQPGIVISGVGPTHKRPNKNGVATLQFPITSNNRYQYFSFGDENQVYDDRNPPNLELKEQECLLKVKLALKGGQTTYTLIMPGDTDYPENPLNPDNKETQTKTFHGFVGEANTGIEGVTITAKNPGSDSIKTATTNETGYYSIELEELKFGTIYLTAKKNGKPFLTSGGKEMYGIEFTYGDTAKSYDFGTTTDKYTPELKIDNITVPYGQPLSKITIVGTAEAGSTQVAGRFSHDGDPTLIPPAGSYSIKVTFTPDEIDRYTIATASINLTITKATPIGKPGYTQITSPGKTLADAGLNLGNISVPGTVAWELSDATVVVANTEYKWVFTPADGANYNAITGNIILYTGGGNNGSSGDSGGSGSDGSGGSGSDGSGGSGSDGSDSGGSGSGGNSGGSGSNSGGSGSGGNSGGSGSGGNSGGSGSGGNSGGSGSGGNSGGSSDSSRMTSKKQSEIPETLGNWIQDQNGWKFVQPGGGVYLNTWVYENGRWYRIGPDEYMLRGWNTINGSWYYLEESGAMKTDWVNVAGSWYYLEESGAMKTDWVNVAGSWYYLEESGAMKTDWVNVAGSWYYLEKSGAMKTGWVNVDGKWYFLYDNGKMAVNVTTPDGYYVDTSGIWQ